MELKDYQARVLVDLADYLDVLDRTPNLAPRRPPKVPHFWPPKLLHPAGGDLLH